MWFSVVCLCLFLGLQTQIHQLSLRRPPKCDLYTPKTVFLRGVSNLGVCAFFVKEKTWFHVLACTPPKNNTRVTTPADSANHVSTLVSTSRELGQGWKTYLQGQERKVLPKSGRMRVCDSSKILLDYLRVLVAQNPPKHKYTSSM